MIKDSCFFMQMIFMKSYTKDSNILLGLPIGQCKNKARWGRFHARFHAYYTMHYTAENRHCLLHI